MLRAIASTSSERFGGLFLMRVVQHFDQAVFQFEALVQQLPQMIELRHQRRAVAAIAVVAVIVEGQRDRRNGFDAWVDLLGQFQTTLIIEGLGLVGQLLVDLKVSSRHVVHQQLAEPLQRLTVDGWRLRRFGKGGVSQHKFAAFTKPAVNQLVNPTPTFLCVLATLKHDEPRFPYR
ncbi:hypothetical protein PSEUDO8O_20267 [Pseudomonas sp. 8O]|nr:hypothetical protein PSEUDO8O_20267 [Pseudomonas sp. 8O]